MPTVARIITHTPPRHADDFLALALLRCRFPDATVSFLRPREITQAALDDPATFVLDVGGVYDPARLNFDHHHNNALPSCLVSVLEQFFPEYAAWLSHPAIQAIDRLDRFHELSGHERMIPEAWAKRAILLRMDVVRHAALIVEGCVEAIEQSRNSRMFWLSLYDAMESHGVLDDALMATRTEAFRYRDMLLRTSPVSLLNYKVVFNPTPFEGIAQVLLRDLGADFLVEPDMLQSTCTAMFCRHDRPPILETFQFPESAIEYLDTDGRYLVLNQSFADVTATWLSGMIHDKNREK